MAIQINGSTKYVQIGAVSIPDGDWTMVHMGSISAASPESFNNIISNANPGNTAATHYVSFLYTNAFKPAVNIKGASLKLDSGVIEHVLPTDKFVLTALRRVGNLMQYWAGVVDGAVGNTPVAKIWEADCTGIGPIEIADLYLYRRDGAYTAQTGEGNFYSWGFTNGQLSETQMNAIMNGSSLTSLGATWVKAYEEPATTGTATVLQDLSANDQDATVFGSPSYTENFAFPSPAAPVGLTYAFAGTYTVSEAVSVSPTFSTVGIPGPTYSVSAGALPDGLTLDPDTGIVSGSPTTAGTASFSITASNSEGSSVYNASFNIQNFNLGLRCTEALIYNNRAAFTEWVSQTDVPFSVWDGNPCDAASTRLLAGTFQIDANGFWNDIDSDLVGSAPGEIKQLMVYNGRYCAVFPVTTVDLSA